MGLVYTEVERLSERAWSGAAPMPQPSQLTEVCWLSRSLRTRVQPVLVADAAADPAVVAVDVPERLRREEGGPPAVVGGEDARTRLGIDGIGVLVAVIDGEVARDHPAFGDRIVPRKNHTTEPWGNPDKHGTAVAGIIGAADAHPGMAPGCEIYCYKVFASASAFDGFRFDGERALQFALEDGVQVANCSWGVDPPRPGQPPTMEEAISDAWEGGMVVVKSAGNNGSITYPGDLEGLVVVGTTTPDGRTIPAESGRSGSRPHLVAPGGAPGHDVSSTLIGGGFGPVGWGSSYAAPVASGALALLLESNPSLSPAQARDRLLATAAPLDGSRRLDLSSW